MCATSNVCTPIALMTSPHRRQHAIAEHKRAQVVTAMWNEFLHVQHRAKALDRLEHAVSDVGIVHASDPLTLRAEEWLNDKIASQSFHRGQSVVRLFANNRGWHGQISRLHTTTS